MEKIRIVCCRNSFNRFAISYNIEIGTRYYVVYFYRKSHKNIDLEKYFMRKPELEVFGFTKDLGAKIEHIFHIPRSKLLEMIRKGDTGYHLNRQLIDHLQNGDEDN